MISRCPSCGAQVKDEERFCPSCGWDFVTRKRVAPGAAPSEPAKPSPAAPEVRVPAPPAGGFSLPPARDLGEPPPVLGLKPLPKLEPRLPPAPTEGENPFTLPSAPPPRVEPEPAAPAQPPAAPTPPPAKEGFGARLMRSLRRGPPTAPPAPAESAPRPEPEAAAPEVRAPAPEVRALEPEVRAAEPEPLPPPHEAASPAEAAGPEPLVFDAEAPAPLFPPEEKTPAPASAKVGAASARAAAAPAAKPAGKAPPPTETPALPQRGSPVYIAAIAGAALGTVSVLAVYLLLRPETSTGSRPPANSPFAAAPAAPEALAPAPEVRAPAPAAPPPSSPAPLLSAPSPAVPAPAASAAPAASPAAASNPERPTASFGAAPRVAIKDMTEAPAPKTVSTPPAPAPAPKPARKPRARPAAAPEEAPRRPKGPAWIFEGVVFDLLSAQGVYGARLQFLDADGNVVGQTDTGPGGRYKVAVPPGPASGYALKIAHGDYSDRYIDEGDATSSLREATPEERRILMQAAARNLPWVGSVKKSVRRDLALVPRSPEEP